MRGCFRKRGPRLERLRKKFVAGATFFLGGGWPLGGGAGGGGVGLDRPFLAEDLNRVEEFYRAHQAPSQVDLCPMHEPSVFEMFKERGYGIAELNNVLYRKLDADEKFPPPPAGCEIRRSLTEEAVTAGAIVESAFF